MSKLRPARLFMSASVVAIAVGGVAHAQAATDVVTLEDVVVTARKREESLQQVPVAVSSLGGAQLERQNLKEPSDLTRTVPSLTISTGTSGTVNNASVTMRGQVSGDVLLNVSQAVGMYLDSVNIPHPVGANGSFFDLERVEVLKGPQGTLYGRNTTGGAINVISRSPDFDGVHGYAQAEYGNYDSIRVGGALNIPLVADVLALRVAAQHWKRDGYVTSRVTGQDLGGDHDDALFRASLKFVPSDTLRVDLKGEWYKANRNGPATTPRSYNGNVQTAIEAANYADFTRYAPLTLRGLALGDFAALGQVIGAGAALVNGCVSDDLFRNCQGTRTRDDVETAHGVLDINWDVSEAVRFRSITGYHWFRNERIFDLDGLPWQILEVGAGLGGLQPDLGTAAQPFPIFPYNLPPDQTSEQFSQEFNLSGTTFDDRLDWLVGFYYADDKGRGAQQFLAFPALQRALSPTGQGSITGAGFVPLSVGNKTWAVYTQNDVKLTDALSVTLGARYTEEMLDQNLAGFTYQTGTGLFTCTAGPFSAGPGRPAQLQTSRDACGFPAEADFDGTSYLASLNWQVTEDHLLYAKTAKGFRGGALQGRANDQPPTAPETATDYEVGFKGDFLGNRLRTNVALYQTNYNNKAEQVISINSLGVTTTILRNAAKARVRGLEWEVTAQPTRGLTLFTQGSYTDAKYRRYPNALTPVSVPATPCTTCIDASGVRFTIPKYQVNIGGTYAVPVGPGELRLSADYSYRSDVPITPLNRDPTMPLALQEEFFESIGLVNARIDYEIAEQGLTLSAFATNLTNEHYQRPSIGAANAGGVQNGLTQEPRYYGISIRKTFGGE